MLRVRNENDILGREFSRIKVEIVMNDFIKSLKIANQGEICGVCGEFLHSIECPVAVAERMEKIRRIRSRVNHPSIELEVA